MSTQPDGMNDLFSRDLQAMMAVAGRWGESAATWKANLESKGYKADKNPAPGATAWWNTGANYPLARTGSAGHAAIVKEVLGNGDIVIDQYNYTPWRYNVMTLLANRVDVFIHVADTADDKDKKDKGERELSEEKNDGTD